MSVTICLEGPGRTPAVTLGGADYTIRSDTFVPTPRKKATTEKRGLTNQRRRQISWNPETWEFTIAACGMAAKSALQALYQSETYQTYTFVFSYQYDYGAEYTASQTVTIDEFDPRIVADNPERWDIKIKLTEWM